MNDFEGRLATLLKEHVHDGLGPRRPAPPLRDVATATATRRPSKRWLPLLAAASVLAAVIGITLVVRDAPNGGGDEGASVPRTAGWQRVDLPTDGRDVYGMRTVGFVDPLHGWVTGLLNPRTTGLARFVIWTTGDGGRTWTLHVPLQTLPATITAATFGDPAHGWLAKTGVDGAVVYATSDGGGTWTRQAQLTGDALGLVAVDAQHAWVYGNLGFLAATTDGRTWTQLSTPENTYPRSLDFVDPLHGWVIEAGAGHAYLTADGGHTWTAVADPGGVGRGPRALDFVSADVGWAVSANGALYATSDGGRTWNRQPKSPDRITRLAFADPRFGWVFGRGGGFRTSNDGRTWTRDDVASGAIRDVAAATCNTLALTTFTAFRNGGCH